MAGKGRKLHTHEIHIRRTENGFIAKHTLKDSSGLSPTDGQSDTREYNMTTPEELGAHVQDAMGPIPSDDNDESEPSEN